MIPIERELSADGAVVIAVQSADQILRADLAKDRRKVRPTAAGPKNFGAGKVFIVREMEGPPEGGEELSPVAGRKIACRGKNSLDNPLKRYRLLVFN